MDEREDVRLSPPGKGGLADAAPAFLVARDPAIDKCSPRQHAACIPTLPGLAEPARIRAAVEAMGISDVAD